MEHFRRAKKIPQKVGTLWYGKDFIHGPRQRNPEDFSRIYSVDRDFAIKRHVKIPKIRNERIVNFAKKEKLRLPKNYRKRQKLVIGQLKKSKNLAVQSILTPIKK